jgi:type IV secretion system protein VirB8
MDTRPLSGDYYKAAETWESNLTQVRSRSLKFAWFVAICSTLITVMALLTLMLLVPLKSFEPYVIEVDKSTGYLEVKRPLAAGDISQIDAVTQSNVARFVLSRETYDQATLTTDFRLTQLYARDAALADYLALYDPASRDNPVNQYGRKSRALVTIKGITLRPDQSALVRFSTQISGGGLDDTKDWVAIVSYQYSYAPLSNETRFENPLGFTVINYRREPEGAANATGAGL